MHRGKPFAILLTLAIFFVFACSIGPVNISLGPEASPTAVATNTAVAPSATATAKPTEVISLPPLSAPTPTVTRPTATTQPSPVTDLTVVFTDDFSSPCQYLPEGANENRTVACDNGEYSVLNKTDKSRWFYYPDSYNDFVVEVNGHAEAGPDFVEYGVIVRSASDGKAFYGLTVSRAGNYSFFRYQDEKFIDLISFSPSSAVKKGTSTNKIKVVAQKNQFGLYVNDQFLNTVTDSNFSAGGVGLFVNSDQPNASVRFSGLRVSRINRTLSLPAGVPTIKPQATVTKPAPVATAVPQPSGFLYSAPALSSPQNGSGYLCFRDLNLGWSGAALGPNDYYLIESTKADHPNDWGAMTGLVKETSLLLHPEKDSGGCNAPWWGGLGVYLWRVTIVRGTQANFTRVSPPSAPFTINYGE